VVAVVEVVEGTEEDGCIRTTTTTAIIMCTVDRVERECLVSLFSGVTITHTTDHRTTNIMDLMDSTTAHCTMHMDQGTTTDLHRTMHHRTMAMALISAVPPMPCDAATATRRAL